MTRPAGPRAFLVVVALSLGCSLATGPAGEVADVVGTWQYTGDQTAPALTLEGTLSIQNQAGENVSGQLSWQESDGGGVIRTVGGPVSGRVIDTTDVDFDVLLSGAERRHVGRISGDTIRGAWVEVSSGRSGEFMAIRGAP